jgi:hypothetical protein
MLRQLEASLQSARGSLPAFIDLINRRMTVSWGTCRRHRHSYGRFEEGSVRHSKQESQQQDMTEQHGPSQESLQAEGEHQRIKHVAPIVIAVEIDRISQYDWWEVVSDEFTNASAPVGRVEQQDTSA